MPDNDDRSKVLVAIEPRAYRHAIAAVIGDLSPRLDVRVVDPEELVSEAKISAYQPALCVLCSLRAGFKTASLRVGIATANRRVDCWDAKLPRR